MNKIDIKSQFIPSGYEKKVFLLMVNRFMNTWRNGLT